MFSAHLKWRKDMGVDDIIEKFNFHERDAFLTLYPQGYHKTDRLGRPIYIQHLGQINVRALTKITTEERMLLFHIQEYERALRYIFPACSLIAGKHVSQTLAIMDLKGVGLRHLSADVKRILSSITRTDQDNYPETLGKTLIINAPTVFRAIWAIVKPMLDVRTQAKIHVCASDYMPELTRWVDPENIPSYLGGKSQGSLLDDVGPWHDPALKKEIDLQRARAEGGAEPDSPLVIPSSVRLSGASSSVGGGGGVGGPVTFIDRENSVSATDRDTDKEENFQDALSRRFSSVSSASAYLSAEEGGYYSSDGGGGGGGNNLASTSSYYDRRVSSPLAATGTGPRPPPVLVPRERAMTPSSDGESFVADSPMAASRKATSKTPRGADGMPGATQISILARVRALEDRLPAAERQLRQHIPANEPLPSRTVGQGTLLGRIAALEKAMDTLLTAQEAAMDDNVDARNRKARSGCCACCSIM
jgi:CRAL/TRIO domain